MSDFIIRSDTFDRARHELATVGTRLNQLSVRAANVRNRLNNQRGFGIESMNSRLYTQIWRINNTGLDVDAINNVLWSVECYAEEADDRAFRILSGQRVERLVLHDDYVPWAPRPDRFPVGNATSGEGGFAGRGLLCVLGQLAGKSLDDWIAVIKDAKSFGEIASTIVGLVGRVGKTAVKAKMAKPVLGVAAAGIIGIYELAKRIQDGRLTATNAKVSWFGIAFGIDGIAGLVPGAGAVNAGWSLISRAFGGSGRTAGVRAADAAWIR